MPPPVPPTSLSRHPINAAFLIGWSILLAALMIIYVQTARLPFDISHQLIGRDFLNMWMGARAALSGDPATLFEVHHYNAILRHDFSPDLPIYDWSYPPHMFLLIWPLGLFGYFAGYALWTALGFGLMLLTTSGVRAQPYGLLLLVLAPVAALNIIGGQNGFFTGVLLVMALSRWDSNPALSGVLLGLLTVKPQLILLVPVALILTRRWRVLAFAAVTAAALCLLTTLIWGPGIWRDYLRLAVPFQEFVMTHSLFMMQIMMPTPYMTVQLLGFSSDVAMAVQLPVSLAALGMVIWTFRRPRDPLLSTAMLLSAALVFTPYAFNYDMVGLTLVLLQLRQRADNDAIDMLFILALWLLPVGMMLFAALTHIGVGPILISAFMWRLWQRMTAQARAPAGLAS